MTCALVWPSVAPPFRLWFLFCSVGSHRCPWCPVAHAVHVQGPARELRRHLRLLPGGRCVRGCSGTRSVMARHADEQASRFSFAHPPTSCPSLCPPATISPRISALCAAAAPSAHCCCHASRLVSTRLVSPPRVSSRLVSRSGWAGTWHATAEMGDAILFDLRTHHRGGQNKASTVRQHGRGPTAACVCIVMLLINSTGTARRTSTSTSTTQAQAASHRSYE